MEGGWKAVIKEARGSMEGNRGRGAQGGWPKAIRCHVSTGLHAEQPSLCLIGATSRKWRRDA